MCCVSGCAVCVAPPHTLNLVGVYEAIDAHLTFIVVRRIAMISHLPEALDWLASVLYLADFS